MKVHKDQIVFREKHLQTEQGRMLQTRNEKWKKLKADIEKNGIINPLICTEKDGKYRLIYIVLENINQKKVNTLETMYGGGDHFGIGLTNNAKTYLVIKNMNEEHITIVMQLMVKELIK